MKHKFTSLCMVAGLLLGGCETQPAKITSTTGARPQIIYKVGTDTVEPDFYAWIGSLSTGPAEWLEKPLTYDNHGAFYRLLITNAESEYTLYIEKISLGEEGCCRKLQWTRMLRLDDLYEQIDQYLPITSVQDAEWESPQSVIIGSNGPGIHLKNLDDLTVQVTLVE